MKNSVNLIGRIGNDLEIKNFENGKLLNISLAVNDDYVKENEKVENTQWINLVANNKVAEFIEKHFVKGNQLAIFGKLKSRTYENEKKEKIYVTEVVVLNIVWEACKNN